MSYNVPFNFNPKPPVVNFDPNNRSNASLASPEQTNPYVPTCMDNMSYIKDNYRGMTEAYANNYGMNISYWTTGYSLANHNPLYGEDPTAKYRGPRTLKAIVDLQSYSSFLTKFGIMSDLDMVIYIPIKSFQEVWGNVFPLAGDLFLIDDSACDRPMGQSPMVFEVTEKQDSINPVDFMAGHYVWKLSGKRYDNSYEPNAPQEKFIGGPVDQKDYGKISSDIEGTNIIDGEPSHDVDQDARNDFDNVSDSIYGKYM
jgi:hypothetical protein